MLGRQSVNAACLILAAAGENHKLESEEEGDDAACCEKEMDAKAAKPRPGVEWKKVPIWL